MPSGLPTQFIGERGQSCCAASSTRKTEQGGKGTPYAGEALNVITATLRNVETGSFQKLLADGLAYAPTLKGADLQKTNLQGAYLGARDERPGRSLRSGLLPIGPHLGITEEGTREGAPCSIRLG